MAITRSQIARQLLAEGGVSLDDAKRMAPEGEFLGLHKSKGSTDVKGCWRLWYHDTYGIPSFVDFGGSGTGYGSAADTFSAASGNPGADSRSDFGGGDGGGNDPIQDQIQSRPVQKTPVRDIVAGGLDTIARFTIPGYGRVRSAMDISNFISRNTQPKVTNIVDEVALTGGRTAPTIPEGDSDTQIAQPIMPIMPLVPKLPTDIEPPKSDMEFVQRFNLPERFRLADGGDVSVKDAEKMAPQANH